MSRTNCFFQSQLHIYAPIALAPPLVQCNGNGRTIMATTGSLKLPERMLLPMLVKCLALQPRGILAEVEQALLAVQKTTVQATGRPIGRNWWPTNNRVARTPDVISLATQDARIYKQGFSNYLLGLADNHTFAQAGLGLNRR